MSDLIALRRAARSPLAPGLAGFSAGRRAYPYVVAHRPLHLPYSVGLGVSRGQRKRFKFRERRQRRVELSLF